MATSARAAPNPFELARLAREHDLSLFRAYSVFLEGWVTPASDAFGSGLEHMRRGVELLREQERTNFDGLLKIALAEAETRAGDPGRAIAILAEARWRPRVTSAIARSKRNCIGRAAKCC